jgi:hypothetical protein
LARFLALPNGIPSHDTFCRVLTLVDPDAFERRFLGRVRAVFRPDPGGPRQVAIDGKTVRRSFDAATAARRCTWSAPAYATHGLPRRRRRAGVRPRRDPGAGGG